MKWFVVSWFFFYSAAVFATTYTATVPGGDWTDPNTWEGGIVPENTNFGDTVNIPAGSVVSITWVVTFNSVVNVYGTLELTSPISTLIIEDGTGGVYIYDGGQLVGSTFGPPWKGIYVGGSQVYSPQQDGTVVDGQAVIDIGGVLPVELIFFAAKASGQVVALTWATASEENFDYFAIERSVDGENFTEIARVYGVGESDTRVDYEYTDEFPVAGRSYYRLRSMDFDGYTEVFDYQMVEVEGVNKDFSIYPNPVEDGRFSVQTNFTIEGEAQLMIYNAMGGVEMTLPVDGWFTDHYVSGLDAGTYVFRLVSSEGIMVKRVMVH